MSLADQIAALATRIGVEIKAVRAAVVNLSGSQTVDGVKTFTSAPVVPVGASAGNPVRRDDARLTDARTPTAHNHSGADLTSGTVPAARLPLVASPPVTVTFASSLTVDPTLGNNFKITATGALALAVSTTGALDAQMIVVEVLASGGSRTVTLNGAIFLSTGLSAATTIASTKVGFFGLRYSILAGGWVLLAAPVEL